MLKTTALKEEHEKMGARMVEFAGWVMPIQYEGVGPEHKNTRENIGVFDVSHMGEILVSGPKALETLQWTTTNDVSKLKKGEAQYSLFPNAKGGIVDDLIVYCIEPNNVYLLCVNASNTDKDYKFLVENNRGAKLENQSSQWAQIALQGPKALKLASDLFGEDFNQLPGFNFKDSLFKGEKCYVARTGYTGEDGVEVFVPWKLSVEFWQKVFALGSKYGAKPVGLAARDTLRIEMKYPLYGQEIDDATNAYEAGLGWVVKPQAKEFLGKGQMLSGKEAGLKRKLIGFKLLERGVPRGGYTLFSFDNREIGKVTSGTLSPSLGEGIGVGYVEVNHAKEGTEILLDIRGKKFKAKVVKTPFVTKN